MKRLTSPSAHTVRGMEGRRRERRVVVIGAEAYILVTYVVHLLKIPLTSQRTLMETRKHAYHDYHRRLD